jgi:hypothetical protein
MSPSGSGKLATSNVAAPPTHMVKTSNTHKPNKLKIKPKKGQLIQETIPLNDVRRSYPRMIEAILNRGLEDCESKLRNICTADADSFLLVLSAIEKVNPFGPVYQEVHGIGAASRYLNAYLSAIPDAVFAISESKFFKRLPGSEIHCNFTFSGSVIHRIVVDGDEKQE